MPGVPAARAPRYAVLSELRTQPASTGARSARCGPAPRACRRPALRPALGRAEAPRLALRAASSHLVRVRHRLALDPLAVARRDAYRRHGADRPDRARAAIPQARLPVPGALVEPRRGRDPH